MDLEKLEKAIDFTTNLFVVRQNEGGVEVFHPMTHHKRVVHTFEQAVSPQQLLFVCPLSSPRLFV